MPHCIAEHSSNINAKILLKGIYDGTLKTNLFESDGSDIKVRAISYDDYISGNEKLSFIHIQLRILSGRSTEQKSMLSESVLSEIKYLNFKSCSITVEVIDIDRASYSKLLS